MVNLELYRVFYTVAKCGSLTKAAQELYISQPAVSQAIKQFENQLGVSLFNRTHKGMDLSASGGKLIFKQVEEALKLLEDAESKLTGIRMDVYTDLPCLQFYSGGQLNGVKGKSGVYNKYAGFCLEPQYCPNAVNMQGFDKPVLKAGEEKKHFIVYEFSAGDGKNRIRRHGG